MTNKNLDTPRRKKGVQVTPPVPTISCGKKDGELLKHLYGLGEKRFNIKEYARINRTPRSSVYNSLNRLELKKLVKRELGDNQITRVGKVYLESVQNMKNEGVQDSRLGCPESNKLSTHYHKFRLPITDKENFRIEKLEGIKHSGIKENKLNNLHQIIITFEDAKVIINPKQVIISLFEVLSDNVEDSDITSLSRALEYEKIIRKSGIITEGIMAEEGHWARIESTLSDFLYEKVDNRYFLELDDGSKFWIDHSNGKQEEETNSKVVRERVDNFLNQVGSNDFDLMDIGKIKESLGFITKLESSRLQDRIEENKLEIKKLEIEKQPLGNQEFKFSEYIG